MAIRNIIISREEVSTIMLCDRCEKKVDLLIVDGRTETPSGWKSGGFNIHFCSEKCKTNYTEAQRVMEEIRIEDATSTAGSVLNLFKTSEGYKVPEFKTFLEALEFLQRIYDLVEEDL